jgi:hypothetical protein
VDDDQFADQVIHAVSRYRFERPLQGVIHTGRQGVPTWYLPASLAVVALLVAALILTGGSGQTTPQFEFVGWSTRPASPNPSLLAEAPGRCGLQASALGDGHSFIQDRRGSAAAFAFLDGRELTTCLLLTDPKSGFRAAAYGGSRVADTDEPLEVDSGLSAPDTANAPGITILVGRVSSAVQRVEVARADGVVVQASVGRGLFLAWWPHAIAAKSVTALAEGGVVISMVSGQPGSND